MDTITLLQFVMYAVFMFSIVAYATLDGFDLGVGCLHLFTKTDRDRRIMINAIGPVWDGNSTWIVIGGGVLFAAFPKVFATLAPNLYTPLMGMLFGFMLRAAAIEFRSKKPSKKWRSFWDFAFFLASFVLAFIVGLILGNLIRGVPLNNQGVLEGGLFALLNPYAILIAIFGLVTFMMHGSVYLLMKTEGAFYKLMRTWVNRLIILFVFFWLAATGTTLFAYPHMTTPFLTHPILLIVPALSLMCIGGVPFALRTGRSGWAFISSSLSICFLMLLFVIGTYPSIVFSTTGDSLTFMNSSVSELALWVLVSVSLSAIPLAFFYVSYIHRIFRGKVRIDSSSY
jgi:cytochrome d ubiquinol oxidase subunit II